MRARGFDGAVIDWYGAGGPRNQFDPKLASIQRINRTAQAVQQIISSIPPLQFALMEDQGAWNDSHVCSRSDAACIQSSIIQDIGDAGPYFQSSNYLKVSGRPVLFFFISEDSYFPNMATQDRQAQWTQIWSQVQSAAVSLGNPLLIFRDSVGFKGTYASGNHPSSNGAYAWVNCNAATIPQCSTPDPYGLNYLGDFYNKAKDESVDQQRWGAAWKGFDKSNSAFDTDATARLPQQCGQTWLKTLRRMSVNPDGSPITPMPYFGDGFPLNFVQIATWNDYDEGTEIETGIDNCFTFESLILPDTQYVTWKLYTQFGSVATMDTLDHFEIYYEPTDTGGNNLTLLDGNVGLNWTERTVIYDIVRRGNHSCPSQDCMEYKFQYNAASFIAAHPHYIYYIYAVAKPGIINKVSNGIADYIVPVRPPRPPRG